MQHYIHGRARIITGLGIVVVDCGVSGDMHINSMPATEQPGNLLSRQLDSIACDRWARLLTKGKGSVADKTNPTPSHNKLGGMLLEATEGHSKRRVDGRKQCYRYRYDRVGSVLGQDPGVGPRL